MTIHVFTTTIEQALNPTICIKTQKNIKTELSLKITFQLNHENIEWHEQPYPELIFLEIINLETNEMIDYEHLPIIAKINIRKQCRKFLIDKNFDPYRNIVPFNCVPYRFSDPFNENQSHTAELIDFKMHFEKAKAFE